MSSKKSIGESEQLSPLKVSESCKALSNEEKLKDFKSWLKSRQDEMFVIEGYGEKSLWRRSTKKGKKFDDDVFALVIEVVEQCISDIKDDTSILLKNWNFGNPTPRFWKFRLGKPKKRLKHMTKTLSDWRDMYFLTKLIQAGIFFDCSKEITEKLEALYLCEGTDFYKALKKNLRL